MANRISGSGSSGPDSPYEVRRNLNDLDVAAKDLDLSRSSLLDVMDPAKARIDKESGLELFYAG